MTADNLAVAARPRAASLADHAWRALMTALVLAVASGAGRVAAQLPPSPAENAAVVLPGQLRLSITTYWERYDRRSGFSPATESRSEPLGAIFSRANVGVQVLPSLGPVQSNIGSLAGIPGYQLSLGSSELRAEVLKTVTPLSAELGIVRRVSLFAALPIISASGETVLNFNPAQNEGNAGFNPAHNITVARSNNTAVRDQITLAANTLEQLLASCVLTPTGPGCAALLPRSAEVQAVINQSRSFRDVMEVVFGTDTVGGAPFIPVAGTPAANAIDARFSAFNSSFREFLSLDAMAPDPLSGRPLSAQSVLTATQFRNYLEAAEFGIGMTPLLSFRRQGIGDIELGARVQLINTFGPGDSLRSGVRATISVLGRMPTGTLASTNVAFDVGTGDGQLDIEVGGSADIQLTSALGISGSARFGAQLPDRKEFRVAVPGEPFPLLPLRSVDRDLGDYVTFSLRPRLNVGPYVTLTGAYDLYSKQEDHYSDVDPIVGTLPDASAMDAGTAISVSRAGLGLRVGNAPAQGPTTRRVPVEFSAMYLAQLGSSGFGVPDAAMVMLQLRVTMRAFGR